MLVGPFQKAPRTTGRVELELGRASPARHAVVPDSKPPEVRGLGCISPGLILSHVLARQLLPWTKPSCGPHCPCSAAPCPVPSGLEGGARRLWPFSVSRFP